MSQLTNIDITVQFSVHRVLQLCRKQSKVCVFYHLMAMCYENLVKHLKLATRQL